MKQCIYNLFDLASCNIVISCIVTVVFFVIISLITYKICNKKFKLNLEKVQSSDHTDMDRRMYEEAEELYRK